MLEFTGKIERKGKDYVIMIPDDKAKTFSIKKDDEVHVIVSKEKII